ATLTLVDGGAGDADGVVNGVIVDPSGPVVSTVASVSGGTVSGGGGSLGIGELLLVMLAFFGIKTRRARTSGGFLVILCTALLLAGAYVPPAAAGTPINVPVGQWTALATPDRNSGVYYGRNSYDGMKHVSIELDPTNGRLYFEAGDYSGASGFAQSYQQETWSLSLSDRLADPSNPNAGWRLEYPYCGPAGQVQPKHPDTVGWVWDSKRQVFWHVPGEDVPSNDLCPGETSTYQSDPATATHGGFIPNHMMTFNPTTQKWTDVSGNVHGPYGNNWKSAYDPATDTIIRLGYKNGAVASVYNISTDSWTDYSLGSSALGQDVFLSQAMLGVDLQDRVIYAIDPFHGRLFRYNMDAHTLTDLGPIPGGGRGSTGFWETYVAWDSVNHVLFWLNNSGTTTPSLFYAYHPGTGVWETLPLTTNIPGLQATGRDVVFDAQNNVLVLMGGLEPAPPAYFYVYRYGTGTSTGTPASVPAATLSLGVDKASVVSGGSVSLTWSGGNVSGCTASGGWSGSKGVSGSAVVGPLSANAVFTLTC
ncbi:MAG: hypothetical protein B7X03_03935, partial [Parcubacteria group bacterium 21-58-10]